VTELLHKELTSAIIGAYYMVFPAALHDIQAVRLDSMKDWLRRCNVRLGIVANFDALRLQTVFLRA
jgi:hypothetical protein